MLVLTTINAAQSSACETLRAASPNDRDGASEILNTHKGINITVNPF
jgi:hypothetical protein